MTYLRDARPDDGGRLTALMLASRAYEGVYHSIIAGYPVTPALITSGIVRLAENGHGVEGFYRLDVPPSELDLMFVADGAQGTGLGRILFEDMAKSARQAGLTCLRIVAHPPAANFYRRMGARDVGLVAPSGRIGWSRPELAYDLT